MSNRLHPILMLAASTALAGCNLAPHYVRPVGAVPAALPQGGVYPVAATDAPDVTKIGWRDFFTDDRLRKVIALGIDNNRDLRLAAANVLQARAQYRVQRADLVPSTVASGGATYTNNLTGATGAATGGAGAGAGAGVAAASSANYQFYSATVGFSSFELDLFGKIRNQTKAAQEQYFASEEAQRSTRITLIAEIASAWLTMASDQDQLRLSRETLKAFKQTLELTRAQFRIGVASELEAKQAETNYQSARNDIATLQTRIAQDQNALNLLVGTTVVADLLPNGLGNGDAMLVALPGNVSSEVLLRRPDVLQAEHQLIAQNANIGAARAAFFPSISLTGSFGTLSPTLGGLFKPGSAAWSFAPTITLPIFEGGQNKANLDLANVQKNIQIAQYEKAIQSAFRDVANGLAARGTYDQQIAALERDTQAEQRRLDL